MVSDIGLSCDDVESRFGFGVGSWRALCVICIELRRWPSRGHRWHGVGLYQRFAKLVQLVESHLNVLSYSRDDAPMVRYGQSYLHRAARHGARERRADLECDVLLDDRGFEIDWRERCDAIRYGCKVTLGCADSASVTRRGETVSTRESAQS
jgi:hypothetical protein